ncbi:hypothetical protein RI103_08070 [Paraburkholderia sp. FT54]|uniref:hypothetical protein n=1 Tax=Paraburkholderia sp. FT54 TaxID=3074437 RepID=UPI002877C863|nr:hypothetical protein [Paraburkholderia sp. FT54]WNC91288.1 hypothetical protein RI103_08070 [Paraburkholderia sp. FT54]
MNRRAAPDETAVAILPEDQRARLARLGMTIAGTLAATRQTSVLVARHADCEQLGGKFEFSINVAASRRGA